MNIHILQKAENELKEIVHYYEEQLTGLGEQFLTIFVRETVIISKTPYGWRKIGQKTRRFNMERFPYLILYIVEDDTVFITAVAHQHRNPEYYLKIQ